MIFLNRIIALIAAMVCFSASLFGTKDAEKIEAKQYPIDGYGSCNAGNGRVSVHDPSIVKAEDGTFYVFGSHACAAKSTDLINWESIACGVNDSNSMLVPKGKTLREVLAEPLSWTDAFQTCQNYSEADWQTGIWAADVIYNKAMGKYCYYACSSVWGTANSVIWFGTSENIEGPYEYESSVVYSGFNNLTQDRCFIRQNSMHYSFTNIEKLLDNGTFGFRDVLNANWFNENGDYKFTEYPNAIDPTVFYDKNGEMWMVYGSYSAGIFIMPLVEETGLPDYDYMKSHDDYDMYFGKQISKTNSFNEGSGEGPYITYDSKSGYYYFFISYCGLNALGGYNIREYRSENPDGPYLDAAGNNALDNDNTGIKLFGNYKFDCLDTAYLAGGHSSCIETEDGKLFQVYHTRFNYGNEWHQVRVHQMARTQSGWATVLPFEYAGETVSESGFTQEEICGEYEFVAHGTISNGCSDWADAENIIAPTQSITLNADGTISGLKVYESIKENTAVSSREVSGSWKATEGTAYITIVIDGTTYEGVFCIQKDESSAKTEKLVFSAIGSNNECVWGVKE